MLAMADPGALLEELETAVARGTAQSRRAALAYATDLLITGRYSDEHTWMFGEIIGLLASEIEAAAAAGEHRNGARAEAAARAESASDVPDSAAVAASTAQDGEDGEGAGSGGSAGRHDADSEVGTAGTAGTGGDADAE